MRGRLAGIEYEGQVYNEQKIKPNFVEFFNKRHMVASHLLAVARCSNFHHILTTQRYKAEGYDPAYNGNSEVNVSETRQNTRDVNNFECILKHCCKPPVLSFIDFSLIYVRFVGASIRL